MLDDELAESEGKNPARAISRGDLNLSRQSNFYRYVKKLPVGSENPSVTRLQDGNVRFSTRVPGRVPGSYATYIKTVDAEGNTIGYIKETFGPDGELIHIKDKMSP